MKTVKRIGVFETNSSSTHTMMLVSTDELERDKELEKPRYRKYAVITDIKDKLLMACGCCYEMFPNEATKMKWWFTTDEDKQSFLQDKAELAEGRQDVYFNSHNITYELARDFLIKAFCERTGDDIATVTTQIDQENTSGRACHKRFFDEGALYDSESSYWIIYEMFNGEVWEIEGNIKRYFYDGNALCYREFWGGVRRDDDDD